MDPGLVRAVKKQLVGFSVEERGPLLEGWIHTVLRAYGEERDLFDDLFFWSPQGARVEVDFLLQRAGRLLALEVKPQSRFSPTSLTGLRAIGELESVDRRILVYAGSRALTTPEGIDVWPVAKLLESLEDGTLW